MSTPPKLGYSNGKLSGANVTLNDPWPTPNGDLGGMAVPGGIQGVIMHTMVGNLPGTIAVFNEPSFQASAHFGIDQEGNIHQFGPVNGWKAWAEVAGNASWYSIEHADNGDPSNPLTAAQLDASAQVVEVLSRPDVGNFPLQVTNSVTGEGYGTHCMGGAAWGGHSCPQNPDGSGPRSGQRAAVIAIAQAIRTGVPVSPFPLVSGNTGPVIVELQVMLNTWAVALKIWPVLTQDGDFGPATKAVVILAQEHLHQRGVTAGTVDMALWEALHNKPH